jgi:hypothetical protein
MSDHHERVEAGLMAVMPVSLGVVSGIVFATNLPFGYWRAHVRRFSWQWFLSIHLPVPLVIALRLFSGIGWEPITFPVLIVAFFAGQFLGGRLPGR